MRIVISSGHGKYVRGASDLIDEVDEARRVVARVAETLREMGHHVVEFNDDTSHTQSENLDTIIDFHNAQTRDLDVSVHFNAYEHTEGGRGTEVLYLTQAELAAEVSAAIAAAGHLINRGGKRRNDLAFLNGTEEPAVLIEVCFVDAQQDVTNYQQFFAGICGAIAAALTGEAEPEAPGEPELPPELPTAAFYAKGKCSWFGGPYDDGVSADEGLAFIYDWQEAPHLFLSEQPPGTSGLARRLDPRVFYVACRWDYEQTPKDALADATVKAMVRANGLTFFAWPADWGPHGDTDRVADLSAGLMAALGLDTDDEVEVIYPAPPPEDV